MITAFVSIWATIVAFIWLAVNSPTDGLKLFGYGMACWWFLILCATYYRKYDK